MKTYRKGRALLSAAACVAAVGLVLTGCTNTGTTSSASTGSATDAAQTAAAVSGPTCSLADYKGDKIDLTQAIVGFSQSEKEDNPFRIAETQSITDEAAKIGVKKFIKTNAQSTLSKQISDINDLISQGAQVLIVAPLNSDGLEPALKAARDKNIPVITIDRKLNATACSDYVSFLGSNFVQQGQRAADQLIAGTKGTAKVAVLLGSSGNGVTTDRTSGFVDEIKAKGPGITIVAQQTGDFARDKGQSVTEQLLQSNPDITAIYAENDEMGLGAQAAIIAAGKTPGKDIQIYSIDGTKNAVSQIVTGAYNGVIESNPRFGPLAFATLKSFLAGDAVGQDIVIQDSQYDSSNAAAKVDSAF
ncbi:MULTISPECIES: ABC transporter substrate-binding protein [Subtercola]|uniref:ABC transporter substrate-binding protein n=1 Tax=Subtercola vilae TaxID=2056433 RepID=A0A4T2BZL6_9MICO|nr:MULTISPECIES: ABC transporter substrate-binding protein [Subtercola]MEA9984650.1 ABC transporter substrate-binding protein [Subtercola sp. RTI3]TIH35306.1 ABC transporter substrate-binding protein [Subtercola vilae]